jgi:hypothetical protein
MANVNKVNGFKPFRYMSGAPYNGAFTKYVVPSGDGTALFVGDVVKADSTGDLATGLRTVIRGTAGAAMVGVVVGFEPDPASLNTPQYRAASTRRIVYVADDPNLLFVAQEDGDTTPIAVASIGLNVSLISTSGGNTTTGASGMQLDSNTVNTTADLEFKIMGVVQSPDNELVTSGQAYTRWIVKPNNHQLASHTGTAGV